MDDPSQKRETERLARRTSALKMSSFQMLLLLLVIAITSRTTTAARNLSFGLLNGGSSFFDPIRDSFLEKCVEHGVTCHVRVGTSNPCNKSRIALVHEFIQQLSVDGIAMKPCSDAPTNMQELLANATAAGVPVVTFDTDVPDSQRVAYVGTDNVFLGRTMARLLRQLRPAGGTFAILGPKRRRLEGFVQEITKYNQRRNRAHWHPVERNFSIQGRDYIRQMQQYAVFRPTAMVAMTQSPMRHANWTDFVRAHRHLDITYIGVDGADYQLDYLNRRYVDGLVGQLPYEIGSVSFDVLHEAVLQNKPPAKQVYATNIVSYNLIPLELPALDVDENLLGNLKWVGWCCFGVVAVAALACVVWTVSHRTCAVVRAAQPFFLIMVATGVLITSSSLVPLSFDDGGVGSEMMGSTRSVGICMATPWLAFCGFTVTFSALFSKTWRVNRLFHARASCVRIQLSERDVLMPFLVLLTGNIVVLLCWTLLDPLTYARLEHDGTDYWNRVISTYGACRSDRVVAYLVPLAVMNVSVVAVACWQAVQTRNIESEFSEAKYIGLAVASLFQGFCTGIPVVVVVMDLPRAYYMVLTIVIFLLCMTVLLLIFLPKIFMHRTYAGLSEVEQRRMLARSLKQSSMGHRRLSDRDCADSSRNNEPFSSENYGMFATESEKAVAVIDSRGKDSVTGAGESKELAQADQSAEMAEAVSGEGNYGELALVEQSAEVVEDSPSTTKPNDVISIATSIKGEAPDGPSDAAKKAD